jgi:hypothetical protein
MQVLISYSRKDTEFVEKLKTALEAGKVGVTIDTESLAFGDDLHEFVERAKHILDKHNIDSKKVIEEAMTVMSCFSLNFHSIQDKGRCSHK